MEASGTGNMKLALNGALTIGTLDGANIEIRERVGAENIFIFGLRTHEVEERRRAGLDATATIAASPLLAEAIALIGFGALSGGDPAASGRWPTPCSTTTTSWCARISTPTSRPSAGSTSSGCQASDWTRVSIRNIANMAWFSSDRTIREYAAEVWNVPVNPPGPAQS